MNKWRVAYSTLAILLGVAIIVFGGIDDSPGAQLIGLLVVIAGVVGVVKSRKAS